MTPGELLRLKSPQSEPCPTLSPTASSPQAPAPGLWDSERAEGLALHTNVLPIVKAPLCQRAPLRRLWGGHNGALSPSSPKQSPAFRASPHHPSPAPVSREHGGVDPGWGGRVCRQYDTLSLDRLVRWAFDRADCGRQSLDHRGGGVLWRELECGSVRPMTEKGTHSLPMLPSICLAWTGDYLAPISSHLMDTWLIYAETHRHTLIYAAPHLLQSHSQANVPSTTCRPGPQVHTTFHQHMHLHTSFPLPPFTSILLQQLPATQFQPPPHPSLPSAALTQVLTSLHLL